MTPKDSYFMDLHMELFVKGLGVNYFIPNGLCNEIGYNEQDKWDIFLLLYPTPDDMNTLIAEGYCDIYWASGLPKNHKDEESAYTTLRQTIILFCHEILNS